MGMLERIAGRLLTAYKAGKVLLKIACGVVGREISNAEFMALGRSSAQADRDAFQKAQGILGEIQDRVKYWSKFGNGEDALFRDLMWSGIEDGTGPIAVGADGSMVEDGKGSEELHDRWIDYLELLPKQQVKVEMSALRKRIDAKSITVKQFLDEIGRIKDKFKSMVRNNRLSSGEDDAWNELEHGRKWRFEGYDVYMVTTFAIMSAVAGIEPGGDNSRGSSKSKTEWCVAKESSYFKSYGPPYYLFAKNHEPEMLLHIDSCQLKDVKDFRVRDAERRGIAERFMLDVLKPDLTEVREDFEGMDALEKYADGIRAADSENLTDDSMRTLASDANPAIRKHLAANNCIRQDVLEGLAEDEDEDVRVAAAGNGKLPYGLREQMAHDESEKVREAIAGRCDLQAGTYGMLAGDQSIRVRAAVAMNRCAPVDALERLCGEDDERMRLSLAKNKEIPLELLRRVGESTANRLVMQTVCNMAVKRAWAAGVDALGFLKSLKENVHGDVSAILDRMIFKLRTVR